MDTYNETELREHIMCILEYVCNPDPQKFTSIPQWIRDDKNVIMAMLQISPDTVRLISRELFNDREFVIKMVQYPVFNYIAKEYTLYATDVDVLYVVLHREPSPAEIKYISAALKNQAICLELVKKDGLLISCIGNYSPLNKTAPDVIIAALTQNKDAAKYLR